MVVLGRIVAPYGVRGWLKVKPFGDDPEGWGAMPQWWLATDAESGAWQAYAVESFRPHGAAWIAKLVGVDDRGGAERLDGCFVGAPREALPETRKDEYYWADLTGLAVVNEAGESMGAVDSLIESGASPVLVVVEGNMRRLLPFVTAVVKDVDVAGGWIRVAWERDW